MRAFEIGEELTLKAILVDAARYRWLRENMDSFLDQTVTDGMSAFCLDNEIDKHLDRA